MKFCYVVSECKFKIKKNLITTHIQYITIIKKKKKEKKSRKGKKIRAMNTTYKSKIKRHKNEGGNGINEQREKTFGIEVISLKQKSKNTHKKESQWTNRKNRKKS